MNMLCSTTLTLLAQTTSPAGPAGPNPGTPSPAAGLFPVALMLAMIVFLFLTMRSQKKREKRERQELNERMRKGDRVLTVGGAIGTIISVKDDEVVVKVDETTNTKMTFIKSAIQKVLE
jgi:preprotein translocase subunit YajC